MPAAKLPKGKNEPMVVILKKGWFEYIKLGVWIILFFLGVLVMVGLSNTNPQGDWLATETYYDEDLRPMDPMTVWDGPRFALLDMKGIILSDEASGIENIADDGIITPSHIRKQIGFIEMDKDNLKGVVVRFSSPGGMVSASDEVAYMIRELNKTLPVYIYSPDLLASGGYYVAVNGSKIYTHRQAIVGSIGVIYEMPNVEELAADTLGIEWEVYKAGKYKDMNSPFRDRTAEEKELIQTLVDEGYNDFVDVIAAGRGLGRNDVLALATGEIWTGKQALGNNLIDKTMYLEEFIPEVKTELGVTDTVTLVQYEEPPSFFDELLAATEQGLTTPVAKVAGRLLRNKPAGLYYLYYR